MKYVITLFAVFFSICQCGCSRGDEPIPIVRIDTGIPMPVIPSPPPECNPSTVDRDVYHCGECGHRCAPANTDRCVAGMCLCGGAVPCTGLTDCRVGRCIEQNPAGAPCEFDAQCIVSEGCIEGKCSFVECTPEVCDGYDNDCDGIIDNNGDGPLAQFCIGDMPADAVALAPPCQQGARVCQGGAWTECTGDIPPQEEVGLLGCDLIDNDCDTCIDGVLTDGECFSAAPVSFDILFVLDQSGSMSDKIDIVKQAVRLFSTRLSTSTAFRWGIIRLPATRIEGTPELYLDLSEFSIFETSLLSMTTGYGGTEPQWDAVYEAVIGELGLSWRDDSTRIIIVFTDEEGQSTRATRLRGTDITEAIMCDALVRGEVLIVGTPMTYWEDWDDCAHRLLDLPAGNPGALTACVDDTDCPIEQSCGIDACIAEVVRATAEQLDTIITDPCGGTR